MADSSSAALRRESAPANDEGACLVERLRGGDASAFDGIVEKYRERTARLCHRLLGWPGEVEDVVQDVFLAAFRALPRFRGDASLWTWLVRITINACRQHRRWRILRLKLVAGAQERPRHARPATPERPSMARETFEQVRRAVRGLPARQREVVVLHYLEQMPTDAISEVLGIRRNTVQVRLHRARARLRDRLAGLIEE